MKFRTAVIEEFEEIQNLYWTLIEKSKNEPSFPGWKKGEHPSAAMIKDNIEKGCLYVLEDDSVIKACVICNLDANEEYKKVSWQVKQNGDNVWILHALAVGYEYRGQGLGKILVKKIISLAEKRDIEAIHLDVISHNTVADRFYQSLGFNYICSQSIYYEVVGVKEFKMYEYVLAH